MKHYLSVVDYTTMIQNILLSLSVIIGGLWALFRYGRRNEDASLSVKIDKISITKDSEFYNYIYTEILIENNGKREVDLYYNYNKENSLKRVSGSSQCEEYNKQYHAKISLYKIGKDKDPTFISNKIGLETRENNIPHKGRLRSGVNIRLPYILEVSEPGLYFIEFTIDINLKSYFGRNDNKDRPIKQWSDRQYYSISESDLNK